MVNDIVGTLHLITVNARFKSDPVWSLGLLTTLELFLKNYPEAGMSEKITSSLFKSCNLDEASIRADADKLKEWAEGKTKEDVEEALKNCDDSVLGGVAKTIKDEEFWMYSKFFGIGLIKVMDITGVEMDKDEVYPVMENWMSTQLGQSHLTACVSSRNKFRFVSFLLSRLRKSKHFLTPNCYLISFCAIQRNVQNDGDLFFRVKDKLDMMETMMKEIEIREKKRMAERLEQKAEAALRAAEREGKMEAEIEKEAEDKKKLIESSD